MSTYTITVQATGTVAGELINMEFSFSHGCTDIIQFGGNGVEYSSDLVDTYLIGGQTGQCWGKVENTTGGGEGIRHAIAAGQLLLLTANDDGGMIGLGGLSPTSKNLEPAERFDTGTFVIFKEANTGGVILTKPVS